MNSESLEKEISKICVACGMCCDGTLFAKANIKDDSDRVLADSLGLSTMMKDEVRLFSLPCHHFESKCTVYDQNRPVVCGSYFCNPIIKLKREKMSLPEAQEIISKTVRLKQQFENALEAYPEFSGKTVFEVRQTLESHKLSSHEQADMRRQYAMLYLVGYKLFPLLVEIAGKGKKAGKKRDKEEASSGQDFIA